MAKVKRYWKVSKVYVCTITGEQCEDNTENWSSGPDCRFCDVPGAAGEENGSV